MSKSISNEVLPADLAEHRAVRAWSRLEPEQVEPEGIEILKLKNKSAVYRLFGVGSNGSDIVAKRCRATTGLIERLIHEEFLARLPLPALRYHGFVEEPDGEFCWLFLERAQGTEYSTGSAEHRALAGRWLAAVHTAASRAGLDSRLPRRDSGHYLELLRTCRDTLLCHFRNPELREDELRTLQKLVSECDALEALWSELEDACAGMPRTLVHGDLVIKNVSVQATAAGLALMAFDWECAGWGVPATDLTQFTGRVLSPDLSAYCAEVNGSFERFDIASVRRLADCGKFFRLLDDISWAASILVFDSRLFLVKPLGCLKSYETRLAEALRAPRSTY